MDFEITVTQRSSSFLEVFKTLDDLLSSDINFLSDEFIFTVTFSFFSNPCLDYSCSSLYELNCLITAFKLAYPC